MNRIFQKSCEDMSDIPDASVQCVVTSPPYYGLRDYGTGPVQIGLEKTLDEYVGRLVNVFREVRRVLKPDGVAWVNLGDSYASHGSGKQGKTGQRADRTFTATESAGIPMGYKAKDLIGVPWRVAFALQADGWYLRSEIIWAKPNPMPLSVKDRPTSAHEHIFLLAKSKRYFYDADAIREPFKSENIAVQNRKAPAGWGTGSDHSVVGHSRKKREQVKAERKQDAIGKPTYTGFNERWQESIADVGINMLGANKRDVWTIATEPYPDAHFATFPKEIPALCIRAGSRVGDLILDPFMGSGTVAEVAESLGRRWVGYELSSDYIRLIAARTKQQGLFS